MDPTSDNRLMEEVGAGRVERLAILFERYHVMLFNFFLRLTGNRSHSEDLVQDVFFRILKYRKTYQGQSKFSVWMYQIARNVHVDHLRKRKLEMPLDDQFEEPASPEIPAVERLNSDIDISLLRIALDRLPLRKKEVLLLSRFQEMKYREIAELLGCDIGSIKSTVHRAIKDLGRIYLELQGGESP
ncbi:MAG TPA: RNA polymerase sigma factor [Candidatus Desulfaltia sp.]|nr:RNA polymerase sigma factor [Candidatus Desulfaltia sp.]